MPCKVSHAEEDGRQDAEKGASLHKEACELRAWPHFLMNLFVKGTKNQLQLARLWACRDFLVLLKTNCRILVMTAKLIPQVSACTKDRDADVLMDARPLKSPAISKGQHQLPTKAGMEKSSVAMATQLDQRSCEVITSPSGSAGGGLASQCLMRKKKKRPSVASRTIFHRSETSQDLSQENHRKSFKVDFKACLLSAGARASELSFQID